jgi:hypothetical protein
MTAMRKRNEHGGRNMTGKPGRYSSAEIHAALFGESAPKTRTDIKQGIRCCMRKRHARG